MYLPILLYDWLDFQHCPTFNTTLISTLFSCLERKNARYLLCSCSMYYVYVPSIIMGITAKNRPQNFIDSAAVVLQFYFPFPTFNTWKKCAVFYSDKILYKPRHFEDFTKVERESLVVNLSNLYVYLRKFK